MGHGTAVQQDVGYRRCARVSLLEQEVTISFCLYGTQVLTVFVFNCKLAIFGDRLQVAAVPSCLPRQHSPTLLYGALVISPWSMEHRKSA